MGGDDDRPTSALSAMINKRSSTALQGSSSTPTPPLFRPTDSQTQPYSPFSQILAHDDHHFPYDSAAPEPSDPIRRHNLTLREPAPRILAPSSPYPASSTDSPRPARSDDASEGGFVKQGDEAVYAGNRLVPPLQARPVPLERKRSREAAELDNVFNDRPKSSDGAVGGGGDDDIDNFLPPVSRPQPGAGSGVGSNGDRSAKRTSPPPLRFSAHARAEGSAADPGTPRKKRRMIDVDSEALTSPERAAGADETDLDAEHLTSPVVGSMDADETPVTLHGRKLAQVKLTSRSGSLASMPGSREGSVAGREPPAKANGSTNGKTSSPVVPPAQLSTSLSAAAGQASASSSPVKPVLSRLQRGGRPRVSDSDDDDPPQPIPAPAASSSAVFSKPTSTSASTPTNGSPAPSQHQSYEEKVERLCRMHDDVPMGEVRRVLAAHGGDISAAIKALMDYKKKPTAPQAAAKRNFIMTSTKKNSNASSSSLPRSGSTGFKVTTKVTTTSSPVPNIRNMKIPTATATATATATKPAGGTLMRGGAPVGAKGGSAAAAMTHHGKGKKRAYDDVEESADEDFAISDDSGSEHGGGQESDVEEDLEETLKWFNEAKVEELPDLSACTPDQAKNVVGLRPFESVEGYQAVDKLLSTVEREGTALARIMELWASASGVSVTTLLPLSPRPGPAPLLR